MLPDITTGTTLLAFLIGLTCVFGFYGPRQSEERKALLPIALLSFAVKAALVPIYYWILKENNLDGFGSYDSYNYDEVAREMATELFTSDRSSRGWRYNDPGYNVMGAGLYWLFGANTLVVRMLNVTVSTFTLLYTYRIGKLAFNADIAKLGTVLTAMLPYGILITIDHRKDPIAQFLATAAFYHTVRLLIRDPGAWQSIPSIAAFMTGIYFVRGRFTLPFLGILAASFFLTGRSMARSALGAFGVLTVVIGVQFVVPDDSPLSLRFGLESLESGAEAAARYANVGGLLRYARMESIADIYKLPMTVVLSLVLPFPPQLDLVFRPGTLGDWSNLLFLALLPQFFLGVRECLRREVWRRRLALVVYVFVFLAFISALNISVNRYKETVFPVALILTAAGTLRRQNLVWIAAVYLPLALLGMLVVTSRML